MKKNKASAQKFNKRSNKSNKEMEQRRQKKFLQNKITVDKEKMRKVEDELFINLLCEFVNSKFKNRFTKVKKSRKYDIKVVLSEIVYFLKSGVSYKNYRGVISKSTLNYYVNLFTSTHTFSEFYWYFYNKYSKIDTYDKLKYLSCDTSFVINYCGLNECVGRNPLMKGKNCIKISLVTDKNGFPIDVKICKGNESDSPLLRKHFEELKVDTKSNIMSRNNRYRPYLMADAMYDAKESREMLKNKGYIVLIPGNRRKTGKEAKKFTNTEKIIYKRRNIIENTFAKIKQYRRLNRLYDKNMYVYFDLLHLSLSRLIFLKY